VRFLFWLKTLLDTLLGAEGRRKAIQTFGASVVLTWYAFAAKASFEAYRDGILACLGFALTAHVIQDTLNRRAVSKGDETPVPPPATP